MQDSVVETKMEHQQQQQQQQEGQTPPRRRKGGLMTLPFIIANEALMKVASFGLTPNMILYMMDEYHISFAKGTNILFIWNAANNFVPVLGAFLSDSYLGRFLTIGLGSIFSLLGMVLLWLTAMIPQARPPPCDKLKGNCKSPTSSQYVVLLSSFAIITIGAAGINPCSLAFGADQVDTRSNSRGKNSRVLEKFFSWYYVSIAVAVLAAFTGIVYLQDHFGWKLGFGVPAALMLASAVAFFLASPFYIKLKPTMSIFTSFARVIVVTYKNRRIALPPRNPTGAYHHNKDSILTEPTDKLKFLNKACVIRSPEDVNPDGVGSNRWSLCTVGEVEELKALIKVIPIWSTGIMMAVNTSQGSFQLLQAKSMDRHITPRIEIPPASFVMFIILGAALWIFVYDCIMIPLVSKIRGKPFRIGLKTRIGLGLFFSILAMIVSGVVEHIRRRRAIASGYLNNPKGVVSMSAMWLVPQHALFGIAEAFNAIAQNEFFYSQLPKSMSSFASLMSGFSAAAGNALASLILNTVDDITKRGGKESWISDNINKGHFESYYWLLSIMGTFNLFYFAFVSWAYGPCSGEGMFKASDERNDAKEKELPTLENGNHGTEGRRVQERGGIDMK